MKQQLGFSKLELRKNQHRTPKELFLAKMESLVPWNRLVVLILPFYPKAGNGWRPFPLESMQRVNCLQQWYNLSDAATEDWLYEIASMRRFAHLSLDKSIPDHTTIMKFRHLLEKHCLGRQIFDVINQFLEESGLLMKEID